MVTNGNDHCFLITIFILITFFPLITDWFANVSIFMAFDPNDQFGKTKYTYAWLLDKLKQNDVKFVERSKGTEPSKVILKHSPYCHSCFEVAVTVSLPVFVLIEQKTCRAMKTGIASSVVTKLWSE